MKPAKRVGRPQRNGAISGGMYKMRARYASGGAVHTAEKVIEAPTYALAVRGMIIHLLSAAPSPYQLQTISCAGMCELRNDSNAGSLTNAD